VLGRRYALFLLGFAALIGVMAVAERAGLARGWIGASFLVVTVAVYAGIGFLCRTSEEEEYFVAGRRVPAMYNGLATAADWMSAASFIGTAGVLYLQGFAGLAYILGWTGGYVLLAVLLAPYLRRFGQYTVPDFLGARYGGNVPRISGAIAAVVVSFVYLVVQIYGVGLITSHLTGFSFELGIFVGLGGVLVCSFLGGMRAVTWTQVAQYLVLIMAYLVPLTWLSIKQTGHPLAALSYSVQLERNAVREGQLALDPAELDVARRLRAMATDIDRKLEDVRGAMAIDAQAQLQHIAALRAANAPLTQIQRAEREHVQRPRTEALARQQYLRERRGAGSLAAAGRHAVADAALCGGRPCRRRCFARPLRRGAHQFHRVDAVPDDGHGRHAACAHALLHHALGLGGASLGGLVAAVHHAALRVGADTGRAGQVRGAEPRRGLALRPAAAVGDPLVQARPQPADRARHQR